MLREYAVEVIQAEDGLNLYVAYFMAEDINHAIEQARDHIRTMEGEKLGRIVELESGVPIGREIQIPDN